VYIVHTLQDSRTNNERKRPAVPFHYRSFLLLTDDASETINDWLHSVRVTKEPEGVMSLEPSKELTKKLAKPAQFVPSHGRGKLNIGGTPGHRGGSGRPPDKLKAFWASVLNGKASQKELRRVLENADHPAFAALYSKLALHLIGMPGKAMGRNDDEAKILVVLDI
jgi:hypothetical protein